VKFKVGQHWRTRNRRLVEIVRIDCALTTPIMGRFLDKDRARCFFDEQGRTRRAWARTVGSAESAWDLIDYAGPTDELAPGAEPQKMEDQKS